MSSITHVMTSVEYNIRHLLHEEEKEKEEEGIDSSD